MRLALVFAAALIAACAHQDPGPQDPALAEDLPPLGRDESYGGARPAPHQDLRQHTRYEAGSAEDPEIGPDGTSLYFASTHDTRDYNLYVKGIDATSVTRLTSGPADERQPRVSPDGRWLAYIGNATDAWEIYLLDLAAADEPTRLDLGPGDKYGPRWSPDGRHLAYCSYSEQSGRFQLWTVDVATSRSTALDNQVPGLFPIYAPDGAWLAFHKWKARGAEYASLWRIRPDGTEPTEIITRPEWGAITPSWDPTGQRLTFATVGKSIEHRGAGFRADDIWVVDAAGSRLTQLTRHPSSDWSPSWHGDRIYFVSDRDGRPNVYSLPAPAGAR